MKKKLYAIGLTLALAAPVLTACGGEKQTDSSTESTMEKSETNVSVDDLGFTEYKIENGMGSTEYIVAVKNNSKSIISADFTTAKAYDADNKELGESVSSTFTLGPDEETCITFYYADVTGIDHLDYKSGMSIKEASIDKSPLANLELSSTKNDKGVELTVKNNGSYDVEYVYADVLFLDADGNALDSTAVFTCGDDDDNKLSAGESSTTEAIYYGDVAFDHAVCYLSGTVYK